MFAAAMLDAFPALGRELVAALRAAGLATDVDVRVERVTEEVLTGTRFVVDDPRERGHARPPHHAVLTAQAAEHAHVPYVGIRDRIARSPLPAGARERALDIFEHLARAEANVHGFSSLDDVAFHEVGAQDSIADVVAAAFLLDQSGARSFSIGSLPIGAGLVKTAHGMLPIPSPATAILLEGLRTHDDGIPGERVTPTGAAIVRHLAPASRKPAGRLGRNGTGWGTKRFAGLPNVLRVLELHADAALTRGRVTRIAFEIDDQSAEDLAAGLDHVRAVPGVLDVTQAPVFGKKGRLATSVAVLCALEAEDAAVRACLHETSTLGVRVEQLDRVELSRESASMDGVRLKRATRPDGTVTTKVESDDVAAISGHAARMQARARGGAP
jgi:pyridinium-3,5-bisthiocarboxylic acid mononucleotide nickel chelatase